MNKMVRMHKNLTFLIVLAFITILTQSNNITVFAPNHSENLFYSNQILDGDFEDDNVIVVLNSKLSKRNKMHKCKIF